MSDYVKFNAQWLSEEEKRLHYASADLCVFPSLSEPTGLVALEAMSMEKPVVVGAPRISGMKEHVFSSGSEQCGLHIHDPTDPASIALNIIDALNNDRSSQWGENGRNQILKYFNWKNSAKRFVNLIESCLHH